MTYLETLSKLPREQAERFANRNYMPRKHKPPLIGHPLFFAALVAAMAAIIAIAVFP